MTFEDWNTVVKPKTKGTWNLHNALLGIDLDFFVILGSLSGIVGQHGQSNYNAANSFLNAFISHRHSLGLAGSMLNLSAVRGIGVLNTQHRLLSLLKEEGAHLLHEREVLEAFHWAVHNSKPWLEQQSIKHIGQSCISLGLRSSLPIRSLDRRHPWIRDRRMALYHNSHHASKSNVTPQSQQANHDVSQRLLDTMQKIHADPEKELSDPLTVQILAEEIAKKAFKMLLRADEEIDVKATLIAVGLDSLMAMQLRQWWRASFKIEVNVLQVANAKTFEGLGLLAVSELKRKLVVGGDRK